MLSTANRNLFALKLSELHTLSKHVQHCIIWQESLSSSHSVANRNATAQSTRSEKGKVKTSTMRSAPGRGSLRHAAFAPNILYYWVGVSRCTSCSPRIMSDKTRIRPEPIFPHYSPTKLDIPHHGPYRRTEMCLTLFSVRTEMLLCRGLKAGSFAAIVLSSACINTRKPLPLHLGSFRVRPSYHE